jgi:hypothetical protein
MRRCLRSMASFWRNRCSRDVFCRPYRDSTRFELLPSVKTLGYCPGAALRILLLDDRRAFSMLDTLGETRNAGASTRDTACARVRPYAITSGISGISAIQRPSFSFSISTEKVMTREESAESDEDSNLFAPSFRESHLHFAVVQELSSRRRARPASVDGLRRGERSRLAIIEHARRGCAFRITS